MAAGTEVARLNEEFERCVLGAGDTSIYLNKQQRRGTISCRDHDPFTKEQEGDGLFSIWS